jgi:acyl-CoA synthetase (AMP-forming)/AMP-acid ligase II
LPDDVLGNFGKSNGADVNTTEFLEISRAICPDRNLMVFDGQRWSFSQTDARVNRLARVLRGFGVTRGDRVGMLQVNCNQYLEAYFAAAKAGAIFVPLNFRAKSEELKYMITHAGVKILFTGKRYLKTIEALLEQMPDVQQCICLEPVKGQRLYYEDLLSRSSSEEISLEIDEEEITILMYTSGTTGRPKGVPLKHSGFISYIMENVEPANPEIEERNLLTVPLYHIAGMQAMLAAVYGGRTLVLMRQFETEKWLQLVQSEKVTRAMLVPTMLKWVIEHPDFKKYDLSSLKVITYGAASMPSEVIKKAIEQLPGVQFINAFGQTETASTITVLGPADHIIEGSEEQKAKKLKRLEFSIGRPLPDVEVKIADTQGKALPPFEIGEILARGPRIMTAYWNNKQETSKVVTREGWLRTGDLGYMDEDGYLFLVGRGDDLIIRGGENISPKEIEDVLYMHPDVEDAAVIGVSDPKWGQQPRAVVVRKKGAAVNASELIEFCHERLAGFKRPRSIVFIDEMPRTSTGKIIKKTLRELYGQP